MALSDYLKTINDVITRYTMMMVMTSES